jgi:hypothetical protein
MANYKAVANGNWSALATWQDDSSGSFIASTVLPGASDVVYFNNFTVQIDVNVTVSQIRNDSSTGVTAGGSGVISASRTVNADLYHAATLLTISAAAPSVVNITGNIPGSVATVNSANGINITGTCTLNYTGNITASLTAATSVAGVRVGAAAVVNITGDVTGGVQTTSNGCRGVDVRSNSTINIVGNVNGGTTGRSNHGILFVASGVVLNITGIVSGSNSTTFSDPNCGISLLSGSNNITTITGVVTTISGSVAINDFSNSQYILFGNVVNAVDGSNPISCRYFFIESTTQWTLKKSNLTNNILYTFDLSDNPAQNNVRSGVVYGPANIFTGTCAVPPAAAVSVGVPVDNTVGTGYLNATDIWNVPLASITTPNSIGERLKDASTVQTTGAQLAAFLP